LKECFLIRLSDVLYLFPDLCLDVPFVSFFVVLCGLVLALTIVELLCILHRC